MSNMEKILKAYPEKIRANTILKNCSICYKTIEPGTEAWKVNDSSLAPIKNRGSGKNQGFKNQTGAIWFCDDCHYTVWKKWFDEMLAKCTDRIIKIVETGKKPEEEKKKEIGDIILDFRRLTI